GDLLYAASACRTQARLKPNFGDFCVQEKSFSLLRRPSRALRYTLCPDANTGSDAGESGSKRLGHLRWRVQLTALFAVKTGDNGERVAAADEVGVPRRRHRRR